MQRLKISDNGHFLAYEDGTPFFYQGDTSWDMFQRLTRDEVELYMSVRESQEFNVLQCILLGGTEPYDYPNKYGRTSIKYPYDKLDFDLEGENSYWDHVDFCLDCAERHNLYIGLLPMWNNKYSDPEDTLFTGYEPSFCYGKFLGERFKGRKNIIWIFGGDVSVAPHMYDIFQGLADGIKEGEGEEHNLITFHPRGNADAVTELNGDKPYLDFLSSRRVCGIVLDIIQILFHILTENGTQPPSEALSFFSHHRFPFSFCVITSLTSWAYAFAPSERVSYSKIDSSLDGASERRTFLGI